MRTVVLLLTDVVGSTRLWAAEHAAMNVAMARHHELLHGLVAEHEGWRPTDQGEGDAVFAAFSSPTSAVACAVAIQHALAAEVWPTSVPLTVRIGVHVGEVEERDGNLFGDPVNRCARLRGLGSGGQTLLSAPVYELVRDHVGAALTLTDLGEHRMKDLTRPERVWQVSETGPAQEFAPLASLDRARHNLPVQTSSFVGRETDLAAVVGLLQTERLVTLVGFGGMGKTRLALQASAELADGDGDGVWFVDLSSVGDAARVPGVIAGVLGAVESGAGPREAVLGHLRDRRLLLVLDNLEQVMDAAGFVSEVLHNAPGVKILATSREALRISGEREYPLQPLALPTQDAVHDLERLGTFAAVQLFVDRAVGVRPDFAVTNANAPAVAAICARLEGHALAIELAAARVKLLSPDKLLERLDSALSLSGASRDGPARHQTLRATIAWSYDGLPAPERALLDRMSVFPGSMTLEAVEGVCSPPLGDEGELDVFDGLAALVDKSLVRADATDDEPRYSLLVSIRAFAAEQLTARGESDVLAGRHARYYAASVRDDVPAAGVAAQVGAIRADLHNLQAAIRWLQVHGTPQEEAAFPSRVGRELWLLGKYEETQELAQHLLNRHPEPHRGRVLAKSRLASLLGEIGQGDEHRLAGEAAIAEAQRLPECPELLAWAYAGALITADTAELAQRLAHAFSEALEKVPNDGPYPGRWMLDYLYRSTTVITLGYVDPDRGLSSARELLADAIPGDDDALLVPSYHLVRLLNRRGRYDEALEVHEALLRQVPVVPLARRPFTTSAVGSLYVGLGDHAAARAAAVDGLAAADALRATSMGAMSDLVLLECSFAEGDADRCRREYAAATARLDGSKDLVARAILAVRGARLARRFPGEIPDVDVEQAWQDLRAKELFHLPELLACLVERAARAGLTAAAARWLGAVQSRRREFVLPLDTGTEADRLVEELGEALGAELDAHLVAGNQAPLDAL